MNECIYFRLKPIVYIKHTQTHTKRERETEQRQTDRQTESIDRTQQNIGGLSNNIIRAISTYT